MTTTWFRSTASGAGCGARSSPRRPGDAAAAVATAVAVLLAGCGGGGDGGATSASSGTSSPGAASTPLVYAASVTIGDGSSTRRLEYTPASGAAATAAITTATAVPLLPVGTTTLLAEHVDAAYPGMRVACVSGRGETTDTIGPINLGVIAQSAAVLLDAGWTPVADRAGAWSALATRATELWGWENCGVKPEGLPSRASRVLPQTDGGYLEDVYDGNPGTTFNVVSRRIAAARTAAMLSDAGDLDTTEPARPLRLYWRVYGDATGRRLWVQLGVPTAGAPATATGFVALYTGA